MTTKRFELAQRQGRLEWMIKTIGEKLDDVEFLCGAYGTLATYVSEALDLAESIYDEEYGEAKPAETKDKRDLVAAVKKATEVYPDPPEIHDVSDDDYPF